MSNQWKTAGIRIKEAEYKAIREAASKKGISPAGLLFALLHERTNGFKDFTLTRPMPRGVVLRPNDAEDGA